MAFTAVPVQRRPLQLVGRTPDAQEAMDALWPKCDQGVLAEIAGRQRRRATLLRMRARR